MKSQLIKNEIPNERIETDDSANGRALGGYHGLDNAQEAFGDPPMQGQLTQKVIRGTFHCIGGQPNTPYARNSAESPSGSLPRDSAQNIDLLK